ncbi:NlpC/P60 family protein [Fodinibius sp. N2]|uniref:NlpC/P60 family protein n=1 Tax=Fodinibius alkaliphilus TaxID=3140241 RepID=UPI00315A64BD
MKIQTVLVVVLVGLMGVACGVVPRSSQPPSRPVASDRPSTSSGSDTSTATESSTPSSADEAVQPAMKVSSLNEVKASLMQAYRDWQGTPYVLGGGSQEGVDCSRLVNIVLDDYFGIDVPTNTKEQLSVGNKIRRSAVRTGDLVFFKTGRKTLHVGIAVNSGEFLHASTSNGVMISKLGKSYWRNRFLAARRVF